MSLRVKAYFEVAIFSAHGDASSIAAVFHDLKPWRTSRSQEVEHSLPVIGRSEVEVQHIVVDWLDFLLPCQMPDLPGGPVKELANACVKSANATEACRHGNLSHGEARLINEFLGKMHAARVRDRYRSGSKMFQEQAPKVTGPDPEPSRKRFDSTFRQPAFANEA